MLSSLLLFISPKLDRSPVRIGATAPFVDVDSIRIPSGSYPRGTLLNISLRVTAAPGSTVSDVRVVRQPFCNALDSLVLTLTSGSNTDGIYSGVIDTGICKSAGETILWPVGKSYLAIYTSSPSGGSTPLVAGEFTITN